MRLPRPVPGTADKAFYRFTIMMIAARHRLSAAFLSVGRLQLQSRGIRSGLGQPEFLEVREYTLKPEGMKDFMTLTGDYKDLRSKLLPFLGMFTCDTGGTLNRVIHFYSYKDLAERDAARMGAAADEQWQQEYLARSRLTVAHQTSHIMTAALPVLEAAGAVQPSNFKSGPRASPGQPPVVYEMRNYQLGHGWAPVPTINEAFAKGLPAKMAADTSGGQLVFFGSNVIGQNNYVTELWRYPSAAASMQARHAARSVPEWREAVSKVAEVTQAFEVVYLHAVPFSPWQ